MQLSPEQQAMLDGSKGEAMTKVMKTLVMYGDAFGAQRMVPVTSEYGQTLFSSSSCTNFRTPMKRS